MIPRTELRKLVQGRLKEVMAGPEIERLLLEIGTLEKEWDELDPARLEMSPEVPVQCFDCWLKDQLTRGADIRVYVKQPRRLWQRPGNARQRPGAEKPLMRRVVAR